MGALPDSEIAEHAGARLEVVWTALRRQGLPLTVDQLAQGQALMLRYYACAPPRPSTASLRRMIGSVFAKGPADIATFEAAWRDAWSEGADASAIQAPPAPDLSLEEVANVRANRKPSSRWWDLVLAAEIALCAAGSIGWLWIRKSTDDPPPIQVILQPVTAVLTAGARTVPVRWWPFVEGVAALSVTMAISAIWFWLRGRRPAWMRLPPNLVEARLEAFGADGRGPGLFEGRGARSLARRLRSNVDGATTQLDVARTVETTAARAGAFVPVFRQLRGAPNHVLIERHGPYDHLAALFTHAVSRLRAGGADIREFYYDDKADFLFDPEGRPVRLRELAGDGGGALIVVGEPKALLDARGHSVPQDRRRHLAAWSRRYLLDTRRLRAWGSSEAQLLASGFAIGPATSGALQALSETLAAVGQWSGVFGLRRRAEVADPVEELEIAEASASSSERPAATDSEAPPEAHLARNAADEAAEVPDPLSGFRVRVFERGERVFRVYDIGEGPPIILLHALPGLSPPYLEFATRLAARGFNVCCPNFFGSPGASPGQWGTVWILLQQLISRNIALLPVRAIPPQADWVQALARQSGADRTVGIIGFNIQSSLAVAAASREPRVGAVVLVQPFEPLSRPFSRLVDLTGSTLPAALERRFMERIADETLQRIVVGGAGSFSTEFDAPQADVRITFAAEDFAHPSSSVMSPLLMRPVPERPGLARAEEQLAQALFQSLRVN